MPRFFVEPFDGDTTAIIGQDAHHIARVLRMQVGEDVTLCDAHGTDYQCTIAAINDGEVRVSVT